MTLEVKKAAAKEVYKAAKAKYMETMDNAEYRPLRSALV